MRARAEALAVIIIAIVMVSIIAFMAIARSRLLAQQPQSTAKALNIYASKTSGGLCITSSMNAYVVIVEYNSSHARVIGATTLKPAHPYCLSTQYNIAVIAETGALFTITPDGRVSRA